jgi:hypothetical protein
MDTGTNENLPVTTNSIPDPKELRRQRLIIIGLGIIVIFSLCLLVIGFYFLLNPELTSNATVARVRDVFIILMALESMLAGLALTILIVQVARLTNLLENEVKPILDSTNETVSNLRGTTKFLSDNLVEPVIKLNEVVAVIQRMTDIFRFTGKR